MYTVYVDVDVYVYVYVTLYEYGRKVRYVTATFGYIRMKPYETWCV